VAIPSATLQPSKPGVVVQARSSGKVHSLFGFAVNSIMKEAHGAKRI